MEKVSVYGYYLKYDLLFPDRFYSKFIEEFGRVLDIKNVRDGFIPIRRIDWYYQRAGIFHLVVSILEEEKEKFWSFFQEFCKREQIDFSTPQA